MRYVIYELAKNSIKTPIKNFIKHIYIYISRYLNLTLRLIPFENNTDYPCHINAVVNSTITGLGIYSKLL